MEDSTRYLGVELQSSMSWNRHMEQAVKKANSTLGFLRRNLRISNEQTKSAAYFSMVRSIIEYCSTVWSPHTKEYVGKVEMVQQRSDFIWQFLTPIIQKRAVFSQFSSVFSQ